VSSAAARPNSTRRCAREEEDRAVHAWVEGSERAELGTGEGESKGTQQGWMERRGKVGIYGCREKQRGSATRAFPDRAGAKPGGSNTTTQITVVISRKSHF
jgi:hypothetical protein